MATIEEDYVSFETAKLLKEKGFNAQCRAAYTSYGQLFTTQIQQYITNVLCSKGVLWGCTAPTLQMAMKWLREVHNLWCEISPEGKGLWYREVYSLTDEEYIPNSNAHKIKSYEEACEAAIKYCLENLI